MKSKNSDLTLLIPGETGWDLWAIANGQSTLLKNTEVQFALDIEDFPQVKTLAMAFPVRELTSLVLWTPDSKAEEIKGMIDLQVEKMGLMQPSDLGNLYQYSLLESAESSKQLYGIDILKAPSEGTLPPSTPSKFNISPRCFEYEPNTTTLWKEFGKWAFAISNANGEPIYYQGITSNALGDSAVQEIQFAASQLIMQGVIPAQPANVVIWTEQESEIPADGKGNEGFTIKRKPSPIMPAGGQLLPADTRAEREAAKRKKIISLISGIAALVVIGCIALALYKLISLEKEADLANQRAEQLSIENEHLLVHSDKWMELSVLTETEHYPAALLKQVHSILPSNEIRLKRAKLVNQPGEEPNTTQLSITLVGESPDSKLALDYDERLQKHEPLSGLQWNNPAPAKSQAAWKFTYYAEQL